MIIDHIAKDFLGAMLRANLTGREAFTDIYAGHFITLAYIGAKDFYEQAKDAGIQVGFPEYEIAKALVQARLASSRLAITPELINILATSSIHMSLANVTQVRTELGLDPEKVEEPKYSFTTVMGNFDKLVGITVGSGVAPMAPTGTKAVSDMATETNLPKAELLVTSTAQIIENIILDHLPAPGPVGDEMTDKVAAEGVAVAEIEVAAEGVAVATAKKKKAKKSKAKKVKAQAKVQTQDDITEMSAT